MRFLRIRYWARLPVILIDRVDWHKSGEPDRRVYPSEPADRGVSVADPGYPFNTSIIVLPSAAGLSVTWTPAARNASIFAAAVSLPPLITAPA